MQSINPATGELLKEYEEHSLKDLDKIIEQADNTQKAYKEIPFKQRAEWMMNAAKLLKDKKEEYGKLMALEMGKPLSQAIGEAEKCAWVCEYYAENAEKFLTDEPVKTDASKSFISFQPLGVVLAVMPWNFPFWQVFRFAAPNLMAGNAGLLKHASNVMGCALAIEDIFREAGFPENLFRSLLIPSKKVEHVLDNSAVKAATLTGSTPAGKAIAGQAGKRLKKTVLELGGSDPYVILKDADLAKAAETCATSRLINGGQSCIAAKRFIVEESVYDKFKALFVAEMKLKTMGDPFEEEVDLGPQARTDLRDELHQQVKKSIELGADVLLGCQVPEGKGAYYPASVLDNVRPGMPAFDEELFGPVAPLIKAKDEDEALELANTTPFGLGAAVFTSDSEKGERIAKEKLNAGACFVNSFVKSDPRLPFGGVKESGYGRELAVYGIKEFVNIKSVYVE